MRVFGLLFAFVATLRCASAPAAEQKPGFDGAMKRQAIVAVMTAAADWQLGNPSKHPRWDWTQAPFYAGLNAFAPLSDDPPKYRAAVRRNGEELRWRPGPRPLCADDHAITQSYFELYRLE